MITGDKRDYGKPSGANALAGELARRLVKRLVDVPQWTFDVCEQDGSHAMYEADEAGRNVRLYWHYGQRVAWDSDKRIVFVQSGTQGGKTSFVPWWEYREILRCGGGDHLVVTVSYDLFKLKLLPEMREVFESVLGVGRYWAGDQVIEIRDPATGQFWANNSSDRMWGRIILRSATAKGGLESATAKSAVLDEAGQDDFKADAWEAIQRRVSLNRGRILITTTPYNLGWLKQRVYDPWERANGDHPEIDLVNFPSTANPQFGEAEMERARESMPLWKYMMFYEGKYTRPAGQIYSDFRNVLRGEGGHLVKPFTIPKEWPRIMGGDPGIIHQAHVWLAIDPQANEVYAYRAEMFDRATQEEYARKALRLAQDNGWNVQKWAIGAKSEIYHREDWQRVVKNGVVGPDTNEVEERIDRVIALLKQYRLFFFDDLYGLIEDMLTYSRETDAEGNATDKIRDKETFHLIDALGYAAQAYLVKLPNWDKLRLETKKYV